MKAALQNYHARMQRVLDYIDRHLDSDLDLETVTGVAAFSKFHFHGPVGRCSPYPAFERHTHDNDVRSPTDNHSRAYRSNQRH
jgi:hypothetical protein